MTSYLRLIALISLLTILFGCVSKPKYFAGSGNYSKKTENTSEVNESTEIDRDDFDLVGEISYYGEQFHGRKTANGETFDMYGISCAHKTLPFDTRLKIVNLKNNKSVIVRVNDRGPFVGDRIIDLSYGAAVELDMVSDGVIEAGVYILDK